jgi:hypothetical protein
MLLAAVLRHKNATRISYARALPKTQHGSAHNIAPACPLLNPCEIKYSTQYTPKQPLPNQNFSSSL